MCIRDSIRVLQSVTGEISPENVQNIEWIVVFDADTPDEEARIDQCVSAAAGGGISGVCVVYTTSHLQGVLNGSLTTDDFDDGTHANASGTNYVCDLTKVDKNWCAGERTETGDIAVGVAVSYRYDSFTGVLPTDGITFTDYAISSTMTGEGFNPLGSPGLPTGSIDCLEEPLHPACQGPGGVDCEETPEHPACEGAPGCSEPDPANCSNAGGPGGFNCVETPNIPECEGGASCLGQPCDVGEVDCENPNISVQLQDVCEACQGDPTHDRCDVIDGHVDCDAADLSPVDQAVCLQCQFNPDQDQCDLVVGGGGVDCVLTPDHRACGGGNGCLLYTSPSPRDRTRSRMPSSA